MNDLRVERRNLLVIVHPGHELRVYGWIARTAPIVCILTDGSGGDGAPRITETLALLQKLGAEIGPVCGSVSDRHIYAEILSRNYRFFENLCERLVDVIIAHDMDVVVSDGMEGYNPTHDLCEVLARDAVALASKTRHRPVQRFTFPLMGDPRPPAGGSEPSGIEVELPVQDFNLKLQTARDYACKGGARLQTEVEETLRKFGEQAFAREFLFAADGPDKFPEHLFESEKPYYESFGEAQVAAGRYYSVIRFREHIAPLIHRLNAFGNSQIADQAGRFYARPNHQ